MADKKIEPGQIWQYKRDPEHPAYQVVITDIRKRKIYFQVNEPNPNLLWWFLRGQFKRLFVNTEKTTLKYEKWPED